MSTIIKKNGDLTIENLYKLEMGMILICGVTHSGKNYILDRLAQTMILSGVYRIYVFSGTHDINMHGYSFTNYCYPIDYKHIKRIFDRQKYLKSLYEKGEISECRCYQEIITFSICANTRIRIPSRQNRIIEIVFI